MSSISILGSEGVVEFAGLTNNVEYSLYYLASIFFKVETGQPFIIFTDPVENGRGRLLEEYINTNKVGTVERSDSRINPNSNRNLDIYIFTPDVFKLRRWLERGAGKSVRQAVEAQEAEQARRREAMSRAGQYNWGEAVPTQLTNRNLRRPMFNRATKDTLQVLCWLFFLVVWFAGWCALTTIAFNS